MICLGINYYYFSFEKNNKILIKEFLKVHIFYVDMVLFLSLEFGYLSSDWEGVEFGKERLS